MGLVNQAQNTPPETSNMMPVEAPAPEVEGLMEQQAASSEDEDNLTPEERESYDAAMNMVSEILYVDDNANASILKQLKAKEPHMAVGELTSFVISQIEAAFKGQVPEELVVPIGDETSDLLMELGEEAGIFKVDEGLYQKTKGVVMNELFDDYGIEEADMEGMLEGITTEEVSQMQGVFGGGQ